MSEKLDKIDLKILKILQDSSKITNLDLSKKIGLSPAPTLERVKKLEQSGVVESYHAQVNPQSIGLNVKTFVLVSLAWQKENALNHFLEKIKEIEEITECYIITGEADFLIKIVCKDIPTYEQLLFKTLSQIEEIERLKTLMTLSTVKDSKVLPYKYDQSEALEMIDAFLVLKPDSQLFRRQSASITLLTQIFAEGSAPSTHSTRDPKCTVMKKKRESMLWRVEGGDLPGTSYILGTMHIRDQRAFGLLDLVYEKIKSCSAFAAEINLEVTDQQQEMIALRIKPNQWLDQVLSPRRYQKMRKIILKGTGLDLDYYRFLHPMIINNLIVEHILSRDMSISLDRHLWDFASQQDKEMLGIETFQEQFSLMEKISFQRHLRDLIGMTKSFSRQRRQMHKLVELYEQGALQRLHQSSKKGAGSLRAMMIYDRNERMANRIAEMIQQRTVFCAIGAGHLGGGKGILRKLKHLGFAVKPVFV